MKTKNKTELLWQQTWCSVFTSIVYRLPLKTIFITAYARVTESTFRWLVLTNCTAKTAFIYPLVERCLRQGCQFSRKGLPNEKSHPTLERVAPWQSELLTAGGKQAELYKPCAHNFKISYSGSHEGIAQLPSLIPHELRKWITSTV